MEINPTKVNLSESDLEEYLYRNPGSVVVPYIQRPVKEWFGRQLVVPSGIIDLVGSTENDYIVLVELKNTDFRSEHLTQICRYAADLRDVAYEAGIFIEPQIIKLLIGRYPPSEKFLFEACALGVSVLTLSLNCEMKVNGPWEFKPEFFKKTRSVIKKLSSIEIFQRLAAKSQTEMEKIVNGDIVNSEIEEK